MVFIVMLLKKRLRWNACAAKSVSIRFFFQQYLIFMLAWPTGSNNPIQLQKDTRNLLQIRAEELQGAQAFLDKADVLSTTDIVEKVTALNSEISQTASLLVNLLHNTESRHWTQRQPTEMTNWMLSENLARDLHKLSNNPMAIASRRREPNHWQSLFLVVFHIAITKWCSMMVNSWVPNDRTLSDSIASIYFGIRQVSE